MRKIVNVIIVITVTMLTLFCNEVSAQIPSGISYQAVIRNSSGELVQSDIVGIRITIQKIFRGVPTTVYAETHTPTTNDNGLISIVIGNGRSTIGTFSEIEWYQPSSSFSLKAEADPEGGTNYSLLGSSSIYSVPFSFLAQKADTVLHEGDPLFWASPARYIASSDVVRWNSFSLGTAYSGGRTITANSGPVEINGTDGLLSQGTYMSGTALQSSGAGTRLLWYPKKSAFRVGTVANTEWNDANIGAHSISMGMNTIASGERSVSFGRGSIASGTNSTAMGSNTEASGDYSVAMGSVTKSTADASTSMGYLTEANGAASTAMGNETTASGSAATALGNQTTANGDASFASGASTTASGTASTAMGVLASTNNFMGSFVIGDASTYGTTNAIVSNSASNQMTMRFAGGYQLYSNNLTNIGVSLSAGGNSWSSISDSTKKENFQAVNGDIFLENLSRLKLGSWNYKGQNPTTFRHFGPMAQEIFHYFGNDGIGTIGCDTTLSTADMDGIMMICLQALENRTTALMEQNRKLSDENYLLIQRLEKVEIIIEKIAAVKEDNGRFDVAENK
jgi:hypothetical protein